MQLDRLIAQGIFAFEQPVELETRLIGPGVIAVVGDNGKGKTSLLEVVPAVNWQRLPARDNDHPKAYATSRQAKLEYHCTTDEGRFRALLQMDAQSDGVDGLIAQLLDDGTEVPLNDGKVSTLKKIIAEQFPSYDLFINSCFAAQGRGDEFARTPATKRKDLFAELLGLSILLERAKTANDAAAECTRVRDRLVVLRDELLATTADVVALQLDMRETAHRNELDRLTGERTEQGTTIAELEARLATMQDAVAAHGAATQRLQDLTRDLEARRAELEALDHQRQTAADTLAIAIKRAHEQQAEKVADLEQRAARAAAALTSDQQRLEAQRVAKVQDCDTKIAGNQQIRDMRARIEQAVAAAASLETAIADTRAGVDAARTLHTAAMTELRGVEQQLADLRPVEQQHTRAVTDAGLLDDVPCHGDGAYAACQLLQNAQEAKRQVDALAARLAPKAALADHVAALVRQRDLQADLIAAGEAAIQRDTATLAECRQLAKYEHALKQSDDRLAELEQLRDAANTEAAAAQAEALQRHEDAVAGLNTLRAAALADRDEAIATAQRQHDEYVTHLTRQRTVLVDRLTRLEADVAAAREDLARVQAGHQDATALQHQLTDRRAALEQLVAAAAAAETGLQHIARERATLEAQRRRLADVRQRLALVDQALVDWRELAKCTGKGGLVDLEIDAAGPTISATANHLLTQCMDGQFSLELVTQVEKRDGGEMKDAFTVRVMDNVTAPGKWRELRGLSGGQKTIVQEALMCAIALYVNEHSPHPMRTLWRDETGAALDRTNALQYVAMLRQVREIGQLHQIYFVTHNQAAADLADAQIVVADGGARIVLPPYSRSEAAA